jgi:hypothetical protein
MISHDDDIPGLSKQLVGALSRPTGCQGDPQNLKKHICGCLGKPVTWSKFNMLSYLHQLKAYEIRMKTEFKL